MTPWYIARYLSRLTFASMFKIQNPDYKSRIEALLDTNHFMKYVGLRLTLIEPGLTEGWLELKPFHKQQKGLLHGGVTSTVADIVAGFAAYTLIPEDHGVVTGEIKLSFFSPGIGEKIHAIGRVIKLGRKLSFCESEVYDLRGESEKLIAKASATMITVFPGDQGS